MTRDQLEQAPETEVISAPEKGRHDRWARRALWITFVVLVVVPLYTLTWFLASRSGLLEWSGAPLNDEQFKAMWAFLGAGIATAATILGALLTKSQADRNLALQRESEHRKSALEMASNERLKLDTVVSSLNLIHTDGKYSAKAVTAGGLATLVHLGHPIIAMRVLSAAMKDKAVDGDTAEWLIGQVLTTSKTIGTTADLDAAKEEAAVLIVQYAATFTDSATKGFSWPAPLSAQWPAGIPVNATQNLVVGLVELLLSQGIDWWESPSSTYTWAIYTLDELVARSEDEGVRRTASRIALVLLEFAGENISGLSDARPKDQVVARMTAITSDEDADPDLEERIRTWGKGGLPSAASSLVSPAPIADPQGSD